MQAFGVFCINLSVDQVVSVNKSADDQWLD